VVQGETFDSSLLKTPLHLYRGFEEGKAKRTDLIVMSIPINVGVKGLEV
jgi:hypothetical protein